MSGNNAAKSAARAYMEANGVKYTVALQAVSAAHEAERRALQRRVPEGAESTSQPADARSLKFSHEDD